jgi:hypothetical protein
MLIAHHVYRPAVQYIAQTSAFLAVNFVRASYACPHGLNKKNIQTHDSDTGLCNGRSYNLDVD